MFWMANSLWQLFEIGVEIYKARFAPFWLDFSIVRSVIKKLPKWVQTDT